MIRTLLHCKDQEVGCQDLKFSFLKYTRPLAEANGRLRSGDKSILIHSLTKDIACSFSFHTTNDSATIIDVWATICAFVKPEGNKDVKNLANIFDNTILKLEKTIRGLIWWLINTET